MNLQFEFDSFAEILVFNAHVPYRTIQEDY